jgi:hypothetical protein
MKLAANSSDQDVPMFKRQSLWGVNTLAIGSLLMSTAGAFAQNESATALPEVRVQVQKPRPKRGAKSRMSKQTALPSIESAPQQSASSAVDTPPLKQGINWQQPARAPLAIKSASSSTSWIPRMR